MAYFIIWNHNENIKNKRISTSYFLNAELKLKNIVTNDTVFPGLKDFEIKFRNDTINGAITNPQGYNSTFNINEVIVVIDKGNIFK